MLHHERRYGELPTRCRITPKLREHFPNPRAGRVGPILFRFGEFVLTSTLSQQASELEEGARVSQGNTSFARGLAATARFFKDSTESTDCAAAVAMFMLKAEAMIASRLR